MTTRRRLRLIRRPILRLLLLPVLAAGLLGIRTAEPASADAYELFRSPTGNIGCMYLKTDGVYPAVVSCELGTYVGRVPARPADCDVDWVASASVDKKGKVSVFSCQGDTIRDPNARVLPYGSTWKRDGFTCTSAISGMRCWAANGRGFQVAKAAVTKF